MRNTIKVGFGVAAALLLVAQPARAQTCTGNPCNVDNTASVTVATVLKLTLSSTTTTLTAPTEAIYDAGEAIQAGPIATVKSNRPWNLQISATTALWAGVGVLARLDKLVGDLQWSRTGGAPFTALSLVPANVYGASQGAGGAQVTTFTYRTVWSWAADTPGDYSLVVRYTVTAP